MTNSTFIKYSSLLFLLIILVGYGCSYSSRGIKKLFYQPKDYDPFHQFNGKVFFLGNPIQNATVALYCGNEKKELFKITQTNYDGYYTLPPCPEKYTSFLLVIKKEETIPYRSDLDRNFRQQNAAIKLYPIKNTWDQIVSYLYSWSFPELKGYPLELHYTYSQPHCPVSDCGYSQYIGEIKAIDPLYLIDKNGCLVDYTRLKLKQHTLYIIKSCLNKTTWIPTHYIKDKSLIPFLISLRAVFSKGFLNEFNLKNHTKLTPKFSANCHLSIFIQSQKSKSLSLITKYILSSKWKIYITYNFKNRIGALPDLQGRMSPIALAFNGIIAGIKGLLHPPCNQSNAPCSYFISGYNFGKILKKGLPITQSMSTHQIQ